MIEVDCFLSEKHFLRSLQILVLFERAILSLKSIYLAICSCHVYAAQCRSVTQLWSYIYFVQQKLRKSRCAVHYNVYVCTPLEVYYSTKYFRKDPERILRRLARSKFTILENLLMVPYLTAQSSVALQPASR